MSRSAFPAASFAALLGLALLACSTSVAPSTSEGAPPAFEATTPPPTADVPYEVLKNATVFEGTHLGYAGAPSPNAKAFRLLLAAPEPNRAMRALYTEGTLVGKLYAVAGLYVLDDPGFEAAARGLAKRGGQVQTLEGCIGGSEPVEQILFANGSRIMIARGESITGWFDHHAIGGMGDIAGGYIPLNLADEDHQRTAPREPLRR